MDSPVSNEKKLVDILGELSYRDQAILKTFEWSLYLAGYNPLYPEPNKDLKVTSNVFKVQGIAVKDGKDIVYRRPECADGLISELEGFETFIDLFEESVRMNGDSEFLGTRQFKSEHKLQGLDGKQLIKYELGDYQWLTYKQVAKRTDHIGSYFRSLGFNRDVKMAIFADTSAEWLKIFLSLSKISSPAVTVYSTLGEDGIVHSLNLTECKGVFVDVKSKGRLLRLIEKLPSLELIVCSSRCEVEKETMTLEDGRVVTLLGIQTLWNEPYNSENPLPSLDKPTGTDLLVIMFTSGSTGAPKGVMISHKNIIAVAAGIGFMKSTFERKTYIGYLPLAHIMELTAELLFSCNGGRIGYGMPLTLLDTSPMLQDSVGDLKLLKPHTFTAVPLLCERIRNGIIEKVLNGSRIQQIIFQVACNVKAHYYRTGRLTPFLDRLVFNKIKAAFGGQLESIMIGGAKLSKETEEFMNVCFGCVTQGYGLTETSIGVAIGDFQYMRCDNVGVPVRCCEVKLEPYEEGGYDPYDQVCPRGEVCVCGGNVALGYYKSEELTNEAFKIDPETGKRWFYTGDIAEIGEDMCLKIIDRKKDIVKLRHGEYVPLAKVENCIEKDQFVEVSCVAATTDMHHLIALVVPNKQILLRKRSEIPDLKEIEDISEIIQNKQMKEMILNSINNTLDRSNLEKYERPAVIHILPDDWLPENNLVTPTMKIRRVQITKKYSKLLE